MTRHKETTASTDALYDLKGLEGNKAFIILIRKALIGTWQSLVRLHHLRLRSFLKKRLHLSDLCVKAQSFNFRPRATSEVGSDAISSSQIEVAEQV